MQFYFPNIEGKTDREISEKAFLRLLVMGTLIADSGDIVSNRVLCKLDTSRKAHRRSSLAA